MLCIIAHATNHRSAAAANQMRQGSRCLKCHIAVTLVLGLLIVSCAADEAAAAKKEESKNDWFVDAAAAKERAREAASNQWHGHMHRLAGVLVGDRRMGDLLGPIMRHKYELPPNQVS